LGLEKARIGPHRLQETEKRILLTYIAERDKLRRWRNNTRHDFRSTKKRKTKDTFGRQCYKVDRYKRRCPTAISWRQN